MSGHLKSSYCLDFCCCRVHTAAAYRQTVKRALPAVGALFRRIQPFPFSRWLHPVARCILTPCLAWCVCVVVRVLAFLWAIWCSPDLLWWEQGKTSGCRRWQPLLITLTTGPEWHHHRTLTVVFSGRQTDMNRIKEPKVQKGDTVEIRQYPNTTSSACGLSFQSLSLSICVKIRVSKFWLNLKSEQIGQTGKAIWIQSAGSTHASCTEMTDINQSLRKYDKCAFLAVNGKKK